MTTTRRNLFRTITGAISSLFASKIEALPSTDIVQDKLVRVFEPDDKRISGWITIAHDGQNLNNHIYTKPVLELMSIQCIGVTILKESNNAVCDYVLCGQVVDSIVIYYCGHNLLKVRIHWFDVSALLEKFSIVPVGNATFISDFMIGMDYKLSQLHITEKESSFQKATVVYTSTKPVLFQDAISQ